MNKLTIAEGVETKDQYEILYSMGYSMIQGYYFGRPMSELDLHEFIDDRMKLQGEPKVGSIMGDNKP